MEKYALSYTLEPTTVVKFIMSGDDLEPNSITDNLGVLPFKAVAKGNTLPSGRLQRTGMWILTPTCSKYESFEVQISQLLDLLESLPSIFTTYVNHFDSGIKVGYSSGAHNFGFFINRDTVRRICRLGLSVDFDIYPVHDDNEEG
jgi:hypothetical protein